MENNEETRPLLRIWPYIVSFLPKHQQHQHQHQLQLQHPDQSSQSNQHLNYGTIDVSTHELPSPESPATTSSAGTVPGSGTPHRRYYSAFPPSTSKESLLPAQLREHQPPPPYYIVSAPLPTTPFIPPLARHILKAVFWSIIAILLIASLARISHLRWFGRLIDGINGHDKKEDGGSGGGGMEG